MCIASLATLVAMALSFSVGFSLNLSVGQSVNPLVKYLMDPRRWRLLTSGDQHPDFCSSSRLIFLAMFWLLLGGLT